MNPLAKQLATQAKIQMCSDARLEQFMDLVVKDVLNTISTANAQHIAHTTYDMGVVKAVVEKVTKHIKTTYKVKYDPYS
jgi:hypothetical protein